MIIIGTAGHIDHGKTSLIGSLTGIQTDRLAEEQARGISIELGFAYLDLSDGTRCGIIDVPGHERFVRQMIAGATGIDLVLLVVAADEGVMQQTREHLDICRLLGIRRGAVVLTKVDLVDDEWLELAESDVEDYVKGTFLEGAPIHHFSTQQAETHAPLRAFVERLVREAEADRRDDPEDRPLRLPVDRVFTMKGFGTVITGTVSSGRLRDGDRVALIPGAQTTRVRGLQSHGEGVKAVAVGQRAAVNLSQLDRADVHRGQVLSHPSELVATRMLDMDLHLLEHVPKPLLNQAKALVHVGTSQITGTVVLLDRPELSPGETAPAQLRLDEFVVALGGDHIVLRGFETLQSYGKTLGGGVIRHPIPRKHKPAQAATLAALEALRGDSTQAAVESAMRLEGQTGITVAQLRQITCSSAAVVQTCAEGLQAAGRAYRYVEDGTSRFVHSEPFGVLLAKAGATLDDYHQRYAHRPGIPREELRSQIRPDLSSRYFATIIATLAETGGLARVGAFLRRPDFEPQLSPAQSALCEVLFGHYDRARLEPPAPADVRTDVAEAQRVSPAEVDEMTEVLIAEGRLTRVLERLVFATRHIERLEREVTAWLKRRGEMTTPELKTITGTTRKFTVPLGEYLDARKITIRSGDVRRLRA